MEIQANNILYFIQYLSNKLSNKFTDFILNFINKIAKVHCINLHSRNIVLFDRPVVSSGS